jgi:multiple sugar transport system substrate-binding protein
VRKDWAEESGADLTKFATFQERLDAAVKMSDPSKERFGWGLTVNKSGDGHGLILNAIHAFGGRMVDETGTKITLNTPEAVAGVQWLADIYMKPEFKDIIPPGVESWTDTSNNEAFLAGKIGITANAASIYAKAKADGNPIFPNISWQNFPTTNDGSLIMGGGGNSWYSIMKGAKNADAAKQIILHFMDPAVFVPLSKMGGGLVMPAYENGWNEDLLAHDPNFAYVKDIIFIPSEYLAFSHPSTPNAATGAWEQSGFQSEMMSNVISGRMTAEQAVADAVEKAKVIFEEKGFPQG